MTKLRIGINGFGRIGRLVARAIIEEGYEDRIELAAINDPGGNFFPLLKYDSIHGRAKFDVVRESDDWIIIDGKRVHRFRTRNLEELQWDKEGVDIVFECTGRFRDRETAGQHITQGAKKVLISAPASSGEDLTVVYGVNHNDLKAEHTIVSNASCTTNCLAPLAQTLDDAVGIKRGLMTTIHAYTGDQNTVDSSHKDPRRARAAAINMIPTSTGAASAVSKVLPQLKGKLDGVAVRVPTSNVSLVDLKFTPGKKTSVEEINKALKDASEKGLKNIMGVTDEPLVSIDFNTDPRSCIADLNGTKSIDGELIRVMAWYDNEWGFSCRMIDTALHMHKVGY